MRIPQSGLWKDSPTWPLLQGLISYWGVTDANGNVGGTTVLCADLANWPSYYNLAIKILSGPAAGQVRNINTDALGVITVGAAFTNALGAAQQIVAGTLFTILSVVAGGGGGAVTAFATGSQLTIIGTEHFLSNVNVAGKYRLVVDKNPMAAGDTLNLRAYQMVLTGGAARVVYFMQYTGAQSPDDLISVSPEIWNELADAQALRFSLQQTTGAVRTFNWKVLGS